MTASHTSDVLLPGQPSLPVSASLPSPFLPRPALSPDAIVLMLAVAIGTATGLTVVIFRLLITAIHSWMLEDLMGVVAVYGPQTLACVPILGGILVGLMRWRLRDFNASLATLVAAAKGIQDLSPLQPLTKLLAAAISLGTGASLGPEGPSVEIGAYFGTCLGQILQVSQERQRLLLGAGAAAGLAAGFNAPIAGVFLALEIVLGTSFATSAASILLLAAVVAALIAQIGLGGQPAFTLPVYEVRSLWELPLYLGLGLLACLVSIAYTESIQVAQRLFRGDIPFLRSMGRIPLPLRPILGGACVGLVALQWPQILGIGYETVETMLQGVPFSLGLLLVLLVVKLLMTAMSLGSGLVGGIFAPALFLGASLGAAYGQFLATILPHSLVAIAAPPCLCHGGDGGSSCG
ncbi:chloride channel protein [Neosynechococcus sphagnicola]|uniref:chloride channel protein n=1 Tax=Neosynechococcus sphagnicola TaxID=1501145 RepID=UPI000907B6E9|nr:chloride channel protein [Neosynechococcus sphagnicola]